MNSAILKDEIFVKLGKIVLPKVASALKFLVTET